VVRIGPGEQLPYDYLVPATGSTNNFRASILTAPTFVLFLVGLHQFAPEPRRLRTHATVAVGIVYAVLVSMVYTCRPMVSPGLQLRSLSIRSSGVTISAAYSAGGTGPVPAGSASCASIRD
jgi:hypothetical protein